MSQIYTIFKNETISNRSWFLGWVFGIGITFLLTALSYPGDAQMATFLELLEAEEFKAFFSDLQGQDPRYELWISIMYPFIIMILLIYSVLAGVKIVNLETDNKTGEIVYTLPLGRRSFYLAKWLSAIFYAIIIVFALGVSLAIPINGFSLEIDKIVKLGSYTFVYTMSGISIGIIIGIITGKGDKGSQFVMLTILFLYVLQSIGRIQEDVDTLNNLNMLELFIPSEILLQDKINYTSLFTLFLILIGGLFLGLKGFEDRDLIEDSGIGIPIPFRKERNSGDKIKKENNVNKSVKSSKSSIFTVWVRPLENRLPITADFVYSERRVLVIMFWAIVMIYPLQLALYPGDELALKTIDSFGSTALFKLFTYNHNLNHDPYLWWLITQAVGNHWMFFLPLVFYWIKKVTINDAEQGTGEILGSQPIEFRSIIFQRIIAILLELIFMVLIMIFFVFISEIITGETKGLFWEAVAISIIIPFYIFWTSLLVSIALSLKGSGVKIARGIYLLSFILFAAAIINNKFKFWYTRGIFGLYDPVLIIDEGSILVNNGGVIIILLLAILSPLILAYSSRYYSWSTYDKEQKKIKTIN